MKSIFYISTFFVFLITHFLFINPTKSTPVASADNSWKNFCSIIAWRETPADNIKHANQDEGRFSNAKWTPELWQICNAANNDTLVNQIKDRADKDELTPDMLFQESFAGTMVSAPFVDDANNFNGAIRLT